MRTLFLGIAAGLVAVVCATGPAAAAGEEVSECDQAMSTHEMNACAEKELEKADAELNAVYKDILAGIPAMAADPPYDAKSFEAALRESQRAWMAFRDADCKGELPMHWTGGSGTTSAVLGCMIEKTEARAKELKQRFESE